LNKTHLDQFSKFTAKLQLRSKKKEENGLIPYFVLDRSARGIPENARDPRKVLDEKLSDIIQIVYFDSKSNTDQPQSELERKLYSSIQYLLDEFDLTERSSS
jgi:hypothetical protein